MKTAKPPTCAAREPCRRGPTGYVRKEQAADAEYVALVSRRLPMTPCRSRGAQDQMSWVCPDPARSLALLAFNTFQHPESAHQSQCVPPENGYRSRDNRGRRRTFSPDL